MPKKIQSTAVSKKKTTTKTSIGVSKSRNITQAGKREHIVRKSYALTTEDINNIQEIKEKCLNRRVVLSDSQVIRLGIKLAVDLSEAALVKEFKEVPQLAKGRPRKI